MSYERKISDFLKPTIITATQYGTKITVEIDHSDADVAELFDAFQTILVGLGYSQTAFKDYILERAVEYQEEEDAKWDGPEETPLGKKGFDWDSVEDTNEWETEEDADNYDDYGSLIPKPNKAQEHSKLIKVDRSGTHGRKKQK